MEMIHCSIYNCDLRAAACASRHLKAVANRELKTTEGGWSSIKQSAFKPGSDDSNCRECPDGKARAESIGPSGIKAYRKKIADCRKSSKTKHWSTDIQKPKLIKESPMAEPINLDIPAVKEKICRKCHILQPLEGGFTPNKECKDGFEGTCLICKRERTNAWYAAKQAKTGKPVASGKNVSTSQPIALPQTADPDVAAYSFVFATPITTNTPAQAIIQGPTFPSLTDQIGGSHYKHFAIQPIEFSTRNNLGFIQGDIVKRICRFNLPGGKGLQDLQKIIHEVNCLIEITSLGKEASHAI